MSTRLHQRAPGRVSRPARATGRVPVPRSRPAARHAFGLGMGVGMTIALIVSAVAFFTTRPDPLAPGSGEHTGHLGPSGQAQQAGDTTPAAAIDVSVTNLGNLQLLVDATVSAPTTYDPITMAQVAAFSDMVSMPLAHRQGPVTMAEQPDRPGHYQAMVSVPMQGEFNIEVQVTSPMAATANKRINVTTVASGTQR